MKKFHRISSIGFTHIILWIIWEVLIGFGPLPDFPVNPTIRRSTTNDQQSISFASNPPNSCGKSSLFGLKLQKKFIHFFPEEANFVEFKVKLCNFYPFKIAKIRIGTISGMQNSAKLLITFSWFYVKSILADSRSKTAVSTTLKAS